MDTKRSQVAPTRHALGGTNTWSLWLSVAAAIWLSYDKVVIWSPRADARERHAHG